MKMFQDGIEVEVAQTVRDVFHENGESRKAFLCKLSPSSFGETIWHNFLEQKKVFWAELQVSLTIF